MQQLPSRLQEVQVLNKRASQHESRREARLDPDTSYLSPALKLAHFLEMGTICWYLELLLPS